SGHGNSTHVDGIAVDGTSKIAANGSATITMQGTGFDGSSLDLGVYVAGTVSSVDGSINITGTGGHGSGTANHGINPEGASARVQATGGGLVILTGHGGHGSTGNFGIEVDGAGPLVQSAAGNLVLNGTGAGAAPNFGISVERLALVQTTGAG